ncbi:MAG: tetratricopeptide repeat protein, partial [Actinobacteria bacterium]|nr:tetratricopeptide repeat protein [Actinomycetota bacterium]
ILFHAINVLLVFLLCQKLFNSKRVSYIASGLFLLLPIHVEAVTFISGRSDLLAFMFALGSLLLLFERKYWPGSLLFMFSLFSKESAALFVPLVFIFWLWNKEGTLKNSFNRLLIFLPPVIIYGLLRYVALKKYFLTVHTSFAANPLHFTDTASRFYTALKVMVLYIWKTFVPLHLSADYSFNQILIIHSVFNSYVLLGVIILAAIIVFILWDRTRNTYLGWGAMIFISSFLVVSNFIFPIGTIMGEREFYLPSLGLVIITAFLIDKLMSWKFQKLWQTLLILLLIFYGLIAISRNTVWADEGTLYRDMVKESPNSAHALAVLGEYDLKQNQWNEGKILVERAYQLTPNELPVLNSEGLISEHEGRYSDAEKFYLKALQIDPSYVAVLSNLSRLYFQTKQYKKAADIFWNKFSYSLSPDDMVAYAMSESKAGNYDAAISAIIKSYGANPNDVNLQFALGYAYYKKGDTAKANEYFKNSKNPNISKEEFLKIIENY